VITDRSAVIDTCVLINLLASGRVAEIVRVIAPSLMLCSAVAEESLYLRPLEAEGRPEAVDLQALIEAGVLTSCQLQGGAEEDLYVRYALELDDGEAMSLAIAQSRDFALVTDERKACRLARENAPHLCIISTAEIIRAWAEDKERRDVAAVVRSILGRARFHPPESDPLASWWNEILGM
jgi:predicted nucleic acid-binding protein